MRFGRDLPTAIRGLVAMASICSASVLAGCGGLPGVGQFLGSDDRSNADCVDAGGANSSKEQIAEAQWGATFPDPETGSETTGFDYAAKLFCTRNELFGIGVDETDDQLRPMVWDWTLEQLYPGPGQPAVPDGGDAAFAAAVCGLKPGWERVDLYGDPTVVAATPNLVRGMGRTVCKAVATVWAEGVLKYADELAELAAADPETLKAHLLAEMADNMRGLTGDRLAGQRARRDKLQSTSAADMARSMEFAARIQWLAVEHQCPDRSRYGFGADCGDLGDGMGRLKIKSGTRTCDEARDVVGRHYNSDLNVAEDLAAYFCMEGGFLDDPHAPLNLECIPPKNTDPDGSVIIVIPSDR